MDGWGALTMLIKRQEAAKNRQAALKYELQKRREGFIKNNSSQKLEFPKISNADMKVLKTAIRKKYKADRIKTGILNIVLLAFVLFLVYYIFSQKNWVF
jgi:hypothetical protein